MRVTAEILAIALCQPETTKCFLQWGRKRRVMAGDVK